LTPGERTGRSNVEGPRPNLENRRIPSAGIGDGEGKAPRVASLDRLRGLILAVMALDHAMVFVARNHFSEFWGRPLPLHAELLPFLNRIASHLCAPGFFFLMGAGLAMFDSSRRSAGWSGGRIASFLSLRGSLLVLLQLLVVNAAWFLGILGAGSGRGPGPPPPGTGGSAFLYFGVLYALGGTMILGALLLRLRSSLLVPVALGIGVLSWFATPGPASADTGFSPFLRLLMVPGQTGVVDVRYPILPWLPVVLLGIVFGRAWLLDRRKTLVGLAVTGGGFLVLFLVLRGVLGVGDHHPADLRNWMGFLNVTKYPPSPVFLLLTLGPVFLIGALFEGLGDRLGPVGKGLVLFGRTPLFFYVTHLYLLALMGFVFPRGVELPVVYVAWILTLGVLLPLCAGYGRFKRARPPGSAWRLF
jgi:uncharacterized membrane protein